MFNVWRYFVLAVTAFEGWMMAKYTFCNFLANMAGSLFFCNMAKSLFFCNMVESLTFLQFTVSRFFLAVPTQFCFCILVGKLHFRPQNISKTLASFQEGSFSCNMFSLICQSCAIEKFHSFSPSWYDSTLALFASVFALVVYGNQQQQQQNWQIWQQKRWQQHPQHIAAAVEPAKAAAAQQQQR